MVQFHHHRPVLALPLPANSQRHFLLRRLQFLVSLPSPLLLLWPSLSRLDLWPLFLPSGLCQNWMWCFQFRSLLKQSFSAWVFSVWNFGSFQEKWGKENDTHQENILRFKRRSWAETITSASLIFWAQSCKQERYTRLMMIDSLRHCSLFLQSAFRMLKRIQQGVNINPLEDLVIQPWYMRSFTVVIMAKISSFSFEMFWAHYAA